MSETATRSIKSNRKLDDYRNAELALWRRYELSPSQVWVDVDGLEVRINEVGSGAPVLFIHGTGGSGVYWAPLVAQLAGEFRCLLLDRPGWAQTDPMDYAVPGFSKNVVKLLEGVLNGLGLSNTHLVGGSIGGLFGLRLAIERPSRVNRLVQLGAAPTSLLGMGEAGRDIPPPRFVRLLRTPLGNLIVRIPQKASMVMKQLAGLGHQASLEAGHIPEEFIDYHVAMSRHTDTMKNERALVRTVLTGDGWIDDLTFDEDDRKMLALPMLMILGERDPIGSVEEWSGFVGSLPDARLEVVPDGGHLPWYDDPIGVADMTRRHLE